MGIENKNKNIKKQFNSNLSKFNREDLLNYSKLVFYQRKEADLWEEETPYGAKGDAEIKSVIDAYDEYYDPTNLETTNSNPDEVIQNVRRMMEGPFNDLTVLSGGAILEHRTSQRLHHVAQSAPKVYRRLLDDLVRAEGGPNIDSFLKGNSRQRIERHIAGELFTFDMNNGETFQGMRNDVQNDIQGLGIIGGVGFVDVNGAAIDLTNINAANEFTASGGAPNALANRRILIRWHQEDFATIRNKLERAGMWSQFMAEGQARQFIGFKFRLSILDQTRNEEKAKLHADRFEPQRLKTWLENDMDAQALREDEQFRTWVTGTYVAELNNPVGPNGPIPVPLTSLEEITRHRPDLYRELTNRQNEARERIREESLENQLKKILVPNELENISTSDETKTLVSYLFRKLHDPMEEKNVREFIRQKAGINYEESITAADTLAESISNFNTQIMVFSTNRNEIQSKVENAENRIGALGTAGTITDELVNLHSQLGLLRGNLATAVTNKDRENLSINIQKTSDRISKLEGEETNLRNQITELQKTQANSNTEIYNLIAGLAKLFQERREEESFWGDGFQKATGMTDDELDFVDDLIIGALNNPLDPVDLNMNNMGIDAFLQDFSTHSGALTKTSTKLEARKLEFQTQAKAGKSDQKMDSRGLLYQLVERDIRRKGVTEETRIQEKSLVTANLLIAKCRNQDIYNATNEHVKNLVTGDTPSRFERWFTPVLTATDTIQHIVDTDPELAIFKDMRVTSTRKDLIQMMHKNGVASPAKLREFVKKLGECIRGIELEPTAGRKWDEKYTRSPDATKTQLMTRIRVNDQDVPYLENVIGMLTNLEAQLSTENFLMWVKDSENGPEAPTRENMILEMLQHQTADSQQLDDSIAESLEGHEAHFKKMFLKKNLKKKYYQAMEKYDHLDGDELKDKLRKEGISNEMVEKDFFNIKGIRNIKNGFKTAFTAKWSPAAWPTYWLAKGTWKLLGMGGNKVKDTAVDVGQYAGARLRQGKEKWDKEADGAFTDTLMAPVALGGWAFKTVWTLPRNVIGWFVPSIKERPPIAAKAAA